MCAIHVQCPFIGGSFDYICRTYIALMDDQGEDGVLPNAAAAFIGAAVTLILVVVFMILIIILVRQCIALRAKRIALRERQEQEVQRAQAGRRRRGSVTEAVPATFDWHHSIRIEGTPPPTYIEAEKLPAIEDEVKMSKPDVGEDMKPKKAMRKESTAPLMTATQSHDLSLETIQGFSSQYTEYNATDN